MKRVGSLIFLGVAAIALSLGAIGAPEPAADGATVPAVLPASQLFDELSTEPDVVYLIANSSVIFGPDPNGRSEEITFVGPVTVPKWPMKGYGRRMLPDGRQQIDIELVQSELTGESYVLGGPVVLGEHPDLRSLGTITERPRKSGVAFASNRTDDRDDGATAGESESGATSQQECDPNGTAGETACAEEPPADFVVLRKVLLTTAKGILYNETAVPVRGRIDAIPPVKFQDTPTGVNVFRGMELPVALLDEEGNVNGWFYSKAHMAYAVTPQGIERSFLEGTVELRSGADTERVEVSGPVEIHYLDSDRVEVMVLALRGHSELLGGEIMLSETFSDRDRFSRGRLVWNGETSATSEFDLFVDVYTPSAKLTTHDPLSIAGKLVDLRETGRLEKGGLNLAMMSGDGRFAARDGGVLYDEAERAVAEVVNMEFQIAEKL